MLKKLIKIGAALFVVIALVLIIGAAVLLSNFNALAKLAIERGGTHATGSATTVSGVNFRPVGGKLSLDKFAIANPAGYSSRPFFALGNGVLAVTIGSLREPVIVVPTLLLEDVSLSLEKGDSGANYQTIMDNLAKLKGDGSDAPAPGEAKKLIINDLTIRNLKVSVEMLGKLGAVTKALGQPGDVAVTIAEIKLANVGRTGTGVGGSGVTASQLSKIILQAVMTAVAENGGGLLPADLLGDLYGNLKKLGDLKNLADLKSISQAVGTATEVLGSLGEAGEKLQEKGQQAIDAARKNLEKGIGKGLGDGLGKVLPGAKEDEPK